MSRDNSTFKECYNRILDLIAATGSGGRLPTESDMSTRLAVSRTTIRGILGRLDAAGIIDWSGRDKTIRRAPCPDDYFPKSETASISDKLSAQFMAYILTGNLEPGTVLRESDLVKRFHVSSSAVREFLIRFSRFGLIEKEPNRHWVLCGFTREFAEELFEVREMFEMRAFETFLAQDTAAATIDLLRAEHDEIFAHIDRDYLKFPQLDERFHRLWIEAHGNRFVLDFFELVSMVFHYHYRWNRQHERDRNRAAIIEHLAIIDAVVDGDAPRAKARFRDHLNQARETMLASALWA